MSTDLTQAPLYFAFTPDRYEDGSGTDHWIAGIYKVTKYEAIETELYSKKERYAAYFKPHGWVNWGNRVDRSVETYRTLGEAQEACQRHSEHFVDPYECDRF